MTSFFLWDTDGDHVSDQAGQTDAMSERQGVSRSGLVKLGLAIVVVATALGFGITALLRTTHHSKHTSETATTTPCAREQSRVDLDQRYGVPLPLSFKGYPPPSLSPAQQAQVATDPSGLNVSPRQIVCGSCYLALVQSERTSDTPSGFLYLRICPHRGSGVD